MNLTSDANDQSYQRLQNNILVPLPDMDTETELFQQTSPVRKQRLLAVTLSLVLTISVLVIAFNGPKRNEILAPGGLTSVHAQILKDQGHERCATCHGAGSKDFGQWFHDALSGGQVLKDDQSHLCMVCHGQTMEPSFARDPHGMDPEQLQKIRDRKQELSGRNTMPVSVASVDLSQSKLACSTCHREHHGSTFDLTAIDNQKCQSCHLERFDRFEGTHSDFSLAATQVAQRKLGFDHRSHSGKHFADKRKSFECNQCHVLGQEGASFGVADFQVACSECHTESLRSTLSSGLVFLKLPSLDLRAIQGVGITLTEWPNPGEFDGQLDPIAALMLGADPEVADLVANSDKGFDFFEVDTNDASQVKNAAKLAVAIRNLQAELNRNDLEALQRRLEEVTGLTVDSAEIQRLVPFAGNEGVAKNFGLDRIDRISWAPGVQFSIQSLQDDELAPNPLKGKFNNPRSFAESSSQGKLPDDVVSQSKTQYQGQPQISGVDSNRPGTRPDTPLQSQQLTNDFPPSSGLGESLASNPLTNKGLVESKTPNGLTDNQEGTRNKIALPMRPTAELPEQLPAAKPFFGDPNSTSNSPTSPSDLYRTAGSSGTAETSPARIRIGLKAADRLVYQPTIHGDPVLQAWIEFTGRVKNSSGNLTAVTLVNRIRGMPEFTECFRCHQSMSNPANAQFVNTTGMRDRNVRLWTANEPTSEQINLTKVSKFSHRPHLLLKRCDECHQLGEVESLKVSQLESPDFVGITKVDCAGCHRTGQADNHCSHCHSYHQGRPPVAATREPFAQSAEVSSR